MSGAGLLYFWRNVLRLKLAWRFAKRLPFGSSKSGIWAYLKKVELAGSGGENICTAHHLVYAHKHIVNADSELVCPYFVGALYGEISAAGIQIEFLFAQD